MLRIESAAEVGILSDDVTFRLLGPVEVVHAGRRLALGAPKQRCVLATLLLTPGRIVPLTRIFDAVWGEDPPDAARKAVQVYISNLRKLLDAVPEVELVGGGHGYGVRVDADAVDLHRFRRLVREAGSGDLAQRRRVASDAAALWRGAPLSDISDTPLADSEQPLLEEERLSAWELSLALDIEVGEHAAAIPQLLAIVGDHPLRESAHVLLMRALHAAGRLAEALAVYRDVRRLTIDELGAEPGPNLTALHQELLHVQNETVAAPAVNISVPAQLPAAVHDFAGRSTELERLTGDLTSTGSGIPIVAVTGYGGAGKTTLAVQTAHGLREAFDGGQLFADLRGMAETPTEPADVLAGFLQAYGVAGDRIPDSPSERAALFRTLTSRRRVLVVLDDAADAAQVRPLLPGNSDCAVLVTSRARLSGLSGVRVLEVGELSEADAVEFLSRIVGSARVTAESAAATRIAAACGRLPLAIRIVGARLAHRPAWSLADLADRLAERAGSAQFLNELQAGDMAVRSSFALGYGHLDAESARAFRLLALPDMATFSGSAAAATLDRDGESTDALLATLTELHLIGEPHPGRYAYHDLLRSYARELADQTDDDADQQLAVRRTFVQLASTAARALDTMMPGLGLADLGFDAHPDAHAPASFESPADAVGWLAGAHVAVTDLAQQTLEQRDPPLRPIAKLARILGNYAELAGSWPSWQRLGQRLLEQAQHADNSDVEVGARVVLGGIAMRRNDADETARMLGPAIEHARRSDDPGLQGRLLAMLGVANAESGRTKTAAAHFDGALRAHGRGENPRSQANVLVHIADVQSADRSFGDALESADRALAIAAGLDPTDEYVSLAARHARGDALTGLGRRSEAIEDYAIAVQLATELGSPVPLRGALTGMARAYHADGRQSHAIACYEQALEHFDGSGDTEQERTVAAELRDVLTELGRTEQAAIYRDRAIAH